MSITVHNISKSFGAFAALRDVSLDFPTGELVALLGPSGSGKTTLLRIIAGLEQPDPGSGAILFQDENRRVGFVFQHYALFRHMSVFENVAFGLRVQPRAIRPAKNDIRERVRSLLALVQLEGFADRFPHQLSGGQRQRIALARALAVEPKVLLLDEPFGALDAKVRLELRRWLRRLHDEIHLTSIFVTHDQEEALEVSDRVVVMDHGQVEQVGSPDEVYNHPVTPFVYHFLGTVNRVPARLVEGREVIDGLILTEKQDDGVGAADARKGELIGYIRPHELEIARQRDGRPSIPARVRSASIAGPVARVELEYDGQSDLVEAVLTRERFDELALRSGELVFLIPRKLRVFAEGG